VSLHPRSASATAISAHDGTRQSAVSDAMTVAGFMYATTRKTTNSMVLEWTTRRPATCTFTGKERCHLFRTCGVGPAARPGLGLYRTYQLRLTPHVHVNTCILQMQRRAFIVRLQRPSVWLIFTNVVERKIIARFGK
jgi:hypothetical protein